VVRSQLYPALPRLPLALCHGDYHPLNVIWRADPPREATGTPQVGAPRIGAVIDWEFSGAKPALYDVALLIGCVGIEQPEALDGAFCQGLLAAAGAHGLGDEPSWTTLVPLVIATRLAWLSEWLRSRDREMISMELAYLDLLVASLEPLGATWRRLADSSDGVRGARWGSD
jgi:homoserine kinase type II